MSDPSQLFLLADHIKLSLLERQRAVSLNLEPNSQDGEISRSLESLREGIERIEASLEPGKEEDDGVKTQLKQLSMSFHELFTQLHGQDAAAAGTTDEGPVVARPTHSMPDLKQPIPQHPASTSKSVRFMDSAAAAAATAADTGDDDPNRTTLFQPYRDSPSPSSQDQSNMSNEQIYTHHAAMIREQDEELDRLGESIGRQHQLSIQIGDELEGHIALLDEIDGDVGRQQTRLDRAKRRLDRIRRTARDNLSMMTIIGLIIVLVILIVILK